MTDISKHTQLPTIQAIYEKYEAKRDNAHRPHLGASQIGHPCDRFLWYQFHWCDHDEPEGRVLRLFNHGDVEEDRIVKDLRDIGATVLDVDPDTGKQFYFTAFGGHMGCSLDGAGQGFPESDKWHLLEFKTASAKRFAKLKKDGLEKWSPQYWAQIIIGMELSDLPRAMHLTTCKDTDEMYGERVKQNSKEAKKLLDRAERVIFSDDPLERISDRPDWYQCKFCCMHSICHGDRVAEVNCRTCSHSTAERDGTWSCSKHKKKLSLNEQREACKMHIMRPSLVPYAEAIDAGEYWVKYMHEGGEFYNSTEPGKDLRYTSHEMRAYNGKLPADNIVEQARDMFCGTLIGHEEC